MNKKETLKVFTLAIALLGLMALVGVLYFGYGDVQPVEIAVSEATLGRLSLAYNLSVPVSVRNPNFLARVWRVAPFFAGVCVGGDQIAILRFAGTETLDADRIRPKSSWVYRAAAAGEAALAGSGGAAAFRRESAVGVFRLELLLAGAFKYEPHVGSRATFARCRLRIPLASSATAAALAAFERMLPSKCELTIYSDN